MAVVIALATASIGAIFSSTVGIAPIIHDQYLRLDLSQATDMGAQVRTDCSM